MTEKIKYIFYKKKDNKQEFKLIKSCKITTAIKINVSGSKNKKLWQFQNAQLFIEKKNKNLRIHENC